MTKVHVGPLRQSVDWLLIATMILAAPRLVGAQSNARPNFTLLASKAVHVTVDEREAASGFLWQSQRQVVTSLHIFFNRTNDRPKIVVTCWGKGTPQNASATVTKTFNDADLVLLTLDRALDACTPFDDAQMNVSKPADESPLWTYGFHAGASGGTSRRMIKGAANPETLNAILNESMRAELRTAPQIPSLALPIYYVQDGLLPGYSGAPVVDAASRLVGIVEGGLDKGASAYNWVIPVENLKRLLASPSSTLPPIGSSNKVRFSSGLVAAADAIPTFGREGQTAKKMYQFVMTKTRTMEQLTAAISNRDGLTALMTYATGKGVDPKVISNQSFELYEDINKNLVIGIPAGQKFETQEPTAANAAAGASVALRTQASDRRDGDLLFQEVPTRFFLPPNSSVPAQSPEFLKIVGDNLLRSCEKEFQWPHQCELGMNYSTPSPNGALLKFSILVRAERPRQDILEYKSLAVRGDTTFYASAYVSLLNNGRMNVSQVANLAAVEIANFGGAAVPPARATTPKVAATPSRPAASATGGLAPRSGRLAEGKTARIQLSNAFTPGQDYEISGECDDDCDDLDLAIFENQDGDPVDFDDEDDDEPWVEFTPKRGAAYFVDITMESCDAKDCEWTLAFDRK